MIDASNPHTDRQKGAALLIVLVLVASLSFVALAITEQTRVTAARSVNVRIRAESQWYALGAEALAKTAIIMHRSASPDRDTLSNQIFSDVIDAPVDNGLVRLSLADDTGCFNLNALGQASGQQGSLGVLPPEAEEFARLARILGYSEFEGQRLASTASDWIDQDNMRLPQGAEDEAYTVLPSPYRTGNRPLASVTELRAMRDVNREIYQDLKPYLCVHPAATLSPININALTPEKAPILAAALGEQISVLQARDIIAGRPAGGYEDVAAFMADPAITGLQLEADAAQRFRVKSQYMRARAEIIYDDALMEMTSFLAIDDNGGISILARRFGAEE